MTKFRKKVNETSSHIKKINGFLLKSGNKDNAIRILYKIMEITLENLYFEIYDSDQREPPPSPFTLCKWVFSNLCTWFCHLSFFRNFLIKIKKSLAYREKKMIMTYFSLCASFLYLNFTDFFSKKKKKKYVKRAKNN